MEKFKPSPEEIRKAEEMMTPKERYDSRLRSTYKIYTELFPWLKDKIEKTGNPDVYELSNAVYEIEKRLPFSKQLEILFMVAKQKHKDIKKVFIITDRIENKLPENDLGYMHHKKSHYRNQEDYDEQRNEQLSSLVLPVFVAEVKKAFDLDPIIIPSMTEGGTRSIHEKSKYVLGGPEEAVLRSDIEIEKGDHFILNKWNNLVNPRLLVKDRNQVTRLPFNYEMEEGIGDIEFKDESERDAFIASLKKKFEEGSEKK